MSTITLTITGEPYSVRRYPPIRITQVNIVLRGFANRNHKTALNFANEGTKGISSRSRLIHKVSRT